MFNRIKNFLVILVVLVVAAVAAWNVNFNSPTRNFSDTMLANVEALAEESSENGGVGSITTTDAGRETIRHGSIIEDCHKDVISCSGTGTLICPLYTVVYSDCHTVH